jgi:hypothetical protein
MGLARRQHYKDMLYLIPVRMGAEKLPQTQKRMLYCDTRGNVNSVVIERSVYERARREAKKLQSSHRNFATVGVEMTPGQTVPFSVEIGSEDVWALDNILEHALKRKQLPDVLKKYPKQIIRLGEIKRRELEQEQQKTKARADAKSTPELLYRLPYYPEGETEATIPIYKAEHRYPLIILKQLPPGEQTIHEMRRILTLDSDGDLAVIRIPSKLIDKAEKKLEDWHKATELNGCLVYSRSPDGFVLNHIEVSHLQKEALDAIVWHFEKTGRGEQPVSADAREVLSHVREAISATNKEIPAGN